MQISMTGILVLTASLACTAAQAQAPAQLAKAQKLFDVMHMESMYDQLTRQVMASVKDSEDQLFPSNNLTPALKQEQTSFRDQVMTLVTNNIAWDKLEPDFAKAYANAYTEEQLDGLITFYSSALGQAVLAKTPELLQQSNDIAKQHLAIIVPQLQQMLHDEASKIQKLTGTQSAPATTK